MSTWIDKKYIGLLSPRLNLFAWKSDKVANCRCPICLDSQKKKTKKRGYFLVGSKGNYFFICHNCGVTMGVGNLIKQLDPTLYKEYTMENFKEGNFRKRTEPKPKMVFKKPVFNKKKVEDAPSHQDLLGKLMPRLDTLDEDTVAVKYVKSRLIPKEKWKLLYYLEDFSKVSDISEKYKDKLKNEPRLVIPFFNSKGMMTALQGRSFDAESPLRYITLKIKEDAPLLFGMERYNKQGKMNVVEGPLDSLFVPNCVAVGGSDLKRVSFLPEKTRFIFDNEPRGKQIHNIMSGVIDRGFEIVIWPDHLPYKDINEMVINGFSKDDVYDIIQERSFRGLSAKTEFNMWKKM